MITHNSEVHYVIATHITRVLAVEVQHSIEKVSS